MMNLFKKKGERTTVALHPDIAPIESMDFLVDVITEKRKKYKEETKYAGYELSYFMQEFNSKYNQNDWDQLSKEEKSKILNQMCMDLITRDLKIEEPNGYDLSIF